MKLQVIYFGIVILMFISCSPMSKMAKNERSTHQQNNNQISMQFNGNDNCCIEMKNCDGIWNSDNKTIYLTGLMLKNDCIGTADEVSIGIQGVDLSNIDFPHVVCCDLNESGYVSWYNESEIKRERNLCSAVESCEYQGDIKKDKIKVTLTGFQNNVLYGSFEGRIFLRGTGSLKFVKTSEYKDISKGTFSVNLNKEQLNKVNNYLVDNR